MQSTRLRESTLLTQSELLRILNHERKGIMEFALTLFEAASTRQELVANYKMIVSWASTE
jgi:hypothetical protein